MLKTVATWGGKGETGSIGSAERVVGSVGGTHRLVGFAAGSLWKKWCLNIMGALGRHGWDRSARWCGQLVTRKWVIG